MKKSSIFKLLAAATVIALVFAALPSIALAAQSGDFTYEVSGSTVTITGYTGSGGAVSIPSTIDLKSVTRIGDQAFFGKSVTSVTLPDSVTSIGDMSFAGCGDLTSIVLSSHLASIESYAFTDSSLSGITIPSSVTSIELEAFQGCYLMTKAVFQGAKPTMGDMVFDSHADGFKLYYPVSQTASWSDYTVYTKQAYCTVTKSLQDGSTPTKIMSDVNGGHITAPASPTRADYTFGGWYKEATCINAWNFATAVITGDIVIYARWFPVVPVPTLVSAASVSFDSIKVSWAAVSDAAGYEVWSVVSGGGSTYSLAGTATTTSFTKTGLVTGTKYYFKVRAYRMSGSAKVYGSLSACVFAIPVPATPTSVAAVSASYISNKVTWGAVTGAIGYDVWGMVYGGSAYSLAGTVTSTSFTQSGLVTGTKYYYKVHAYRTINSTKIYGSWSAVVYAIPDLASPAPVKAARISSTGINVSWGAVGGAAGYEVWRYTAAAGIYSLAKTTANLSFTNTGLVTGTKYCYKVRAYRWVNSIRVYGGYSTYVSVIP